MVKRRRWFRYSLRTLLILLTLFGVWLGVQGKWVRDRQRMLQWLSTKPVTIQYGPAPWPLAISTTKGVKNILWCYTNGPSPAERESHRKLQTELENLFPEAKVEFAICWGWSSASNNEPTSSTSHF